MVRAAIQDVALPHRTFGRQGRHVRVACAKANDALGPGDLVEAAAAAPMPQSRTRAAVWLSKAFEQAADTIGGEGNRDFKA